MKIEIKEAIKETKSLTASDLRPGEVFIFEDNNEHYYIRLDNECFAELENGMYTDINSIIAEREAFYSHPVKKVKCKLVIEGEE